MGKKDLSANEDRTIGWCVRLTRGGLATRTPVTFDHKE